MAISLSPSSIPCLRSENPVGSVGASSSLSPLGLRFPASSRGFGGGGSQRISVNSKPRSFSLVVEAKKQTYNSFDDLLAKSEKPVLVDFYATWCGPCQFMVPILNEVSIRLKDTIQVVKIDTEKYPSIADKYRIEALPTFIIFKDGEPFERFEGALTADQLIQQIEDSLKVKQ
ncbi:thioredoxin Y1, chloroplastic-like [Rhodamnia argentea]|uniref:Thioredoxin Y1, chloroplastic-like n=1 Tax=Rhodamnia argentea TaxID=178133 RepID=A0A8B8QAB1_9MYRT|nr:thioredoxin Y1, chloroplastic-like [Rhodamnia argentea]XP_030544069.1 thioredoxin Y1, chloroplastic-like [Rhodamnia argentea]